MDYIRNYRYFACLVSTLLITSCGGYIKPTITGKKDLKTGTTGLEAKVEIGKVIDLPDKF